MHKFNTARLKHYRVDEKLNICGKINKIKFINSQSVYVWRMLLLHD